MDRKELNGRGCRRQVGLFEEIAEAGEVVDVEDRDAEVQVDIRGEGDDLREVADRRRGAGRPNDLDLRLGCGLVALGEDDVRVVPDLRGELIQGPLRG